HLAAAVGTPTVVIFGSTSSAWSAPLGPRVRVVQRAPVCAPCFQRTCVIGYRCLTAIAVADVERACREVAACGRRAAWAEGRRPESDRSRRRARRRIRAHAARGGRA